MLKGILKLASHIKSSAIDVIKPSQREKNRFFMDVKGHFKLSIHPKEELG